VQWWQFACRIACAPTQRHVSHEADVVRGSWCVVRGVGFCVVLRVVCVCLYAVLECCLCSGFNRMCMLVFVVNQILRVNIVERYVVFPLFGLLFSSLCIQLYNYTSPLHTMNVFRLLGDLLHVLSFIFLFYQIRAHRSCAGMFCFRCV
jgi:hypothetical protein